jgi:hypothetical protein
MKEAYLHNRTDPKGKDDDFKRVWIGAARLFYSANVRANKFGLCGFRQDAWMLS